jgi:hypothetical protein
VSLEVDDPHGVRDTSGDIRGLAIVGDRELVCIGYFRSPEQLSRASGRRGQEREPLGGMVARHVCRVAVIFVLQHTEE